MLSETSAFIGFYRLFQAWAAPARQRPRRGPCGFVVRLGDLPMPRPASLRPLIFQAGAARVLRAIDAEAGTILVGECGIRGFVGGRRVAPRSLDRARIGGGVERAVMH